MFHVLHWQWNKTLENYRLQISHKLDEVWNAFFKFAWQFLQKIIVNFYTGCERKKHFLENMFVTATELSFLESKNVIKSALPLKLKIGFRNVSVFKYLQIRSLPNIAINSIKSHLWHRCTFLIYVNKCNDLYLEFIMKSFLINDYFLSPPVQMYDGSIYIISHLSVWASLGQKSN